MAKKTTDQKKYTASFQQPPPPSTVTSYLERIPHAFILAAIALITWLCLKASLNNLFTDWDDKGYILNNDLVKNISPAGLKNIFSSPVMGNYHPITILLYAIEYSFVQFDPWLYHFDSLVLHILVTLAVYWFAHLFTHNKIAAIITALLFGLHPMHVESVAWVAGRKDVLCALFYFAACIAYVYFTRADGQRKKAWYISVVALFICALLSKPTAVTLPLILLLIDYYEKRTGTKNAIYNKIPFFILAIIFGAISVNIQHGGGAMAIHKESYTLLQRAGLSAYALVTYLWKAVLPAGLHCFYPYPAKTNGTLPFIYNIYPLIIVAIIIAVWKYARHKKEIIFGLLFFMANIILLLQLIPVGDALVAERYSYISYFGLFLISGHYLGQYFVAGSNRKVKYLLLAACLLCISCFFYLSNERCKVWYNAYTLWTDEIKAEPMRAPLAYNNIGFYFFEKRMAAETDPVERKDDNDSALYYLNEAINLKPDFANAYEGLGILYTWNGNPEAAGNCFRTLIRLIPCSNSYYDYGTVLYATGKKDSAVIEYSRSIVLDSNNYSPYINRGIIYKEMKRWNDAANDFEKVIKLKPDMGIVYYQRSFCDTQKGQNALALQDVEKAVSLGYNDIDTGYYRILKTK